MSDPELLYGRRPFVVAALARNAAFALALVGILALGFSKTLSAALLVGGFVVAFGAHLVIGVLGYRRAMRAPWPHVAPVEDDDWD